jgi:outer membrane receptor protein involved in Fe transport
VVHANRIRIAGAWIAKVCGAVLVTALMVPRSDASDAINSADATDTNGLSEITITAQKYNSTIQDTPISISAISGDQLSSAGITTVEGLVGEVPGLSMRSAGPGQSEYEARGLASNGGAAPTVGFYLDEVPLSPPALAQVGKVVIDPDLYDVDRIEVLRGPQGTLYGSGSMGGTVKVVTNQPKLETYEGSIQGNLSDTPTGSGNGGGNLMVNIPIGDLFALRVVGTDTYRSGWIDRIVLDPFPPDTTTRGNVLAAPVQSVATDVNTETLYGGRASLLFQPSNDLSILATALYQRMAMGGYDEFDLPPGPDYLAHYEAFPIRERISDTAHIYSLTIKDNLGFADLTSSTAYWRREESQTQDASESASYTAGLPADGLPEYVSVPYSEIDLTRQFSEEIRLTSRRDERLHWIAGAFYSDLHSTWIEIDSNPLMSALSPPGANPSGTFFDADNPYHIRELAAFADGSYNLTDTLKFSSGVRWFRYLSEAFENEWGLDASSFTPLASPLETTASAHGFNPRFNFSYSPSGDLTAYVSASKGFRPGGANEQVPVNLCGASPISFGPDSVWDYELGEKARLLDNRLTIDGDFYYIAWTGIQEALLLTCGYEYNANAGNARSFGPELEVKAKVTRQITVTVNGDYTDAKITKPSSVLASSLAGTIASCPRVGDCTVPVLNVPKDTGSVSLLYSTTVLQGYQFTARVSDSYVGPATDESFYFGIHLPPYAIASARASLSKDKWSAAIFVDNLTNKVAELTANNTSFQYNIPALVRISTNQPRTFGTQVNYRF